MKRHRFRVPSWKEGEELMKKIASENNFKLEEVDADFRISDDKFVLTCHLDEGQFCFILLKIYDETMEAKLVEYFKPYQ